MTSYAVDTSVAVAALDPLHVAHGACRAICAERRPALCGHACFETYSVLTRLPGSAVVSPQVAGRLLAQAFPSRCWLTADDQSELYSQLARLDIRGGMVYDALVGAAASKAGLVLLSRDRRAGRTYDLVGTRHEFVE